MISRLRVIASVAAVFVLLASSPALAGHSWNGYHFPSDNLIPTVTGETSLTTVSAVVGDWAGLRTNISQRT